MTQSPDLKPLLTRLRTMASYPHKSYPTHFVNPDGPDAAKVIEAQAARIRGLGEALEPFGRDYRSAGAEHLPDNARFGEIDNDNSELTVGDFRRAALTLNRSEDNGK